MASGGPDEGLEALVMLGEVPVDRSLEVGQRMEHAGPPVPGRGCARSSAPC
jgi:hypothetical protein